jgi:hypothetical protein
MNRIKMCSPQSLWINSMSPGVHSRSVPHGARMKQNRKLDFPLPSDGVGGGQEEQPCLQEVVISQRGSGGLEPGVGVLVTLPYASPRLFAQLNSTGRKCKWLALREELYRRHFTSSKPVR